MSNPEIARHFKELATLLEFHQDNPFKIRSYNNAYNKLRKDDRTLAEMSERELQALEGVGKNIAAKIHEVATTGRMATLEKWRAQTPEGLRQMLTIRGFGPKKVKAVWEGLGVTTVGQLLYAINENRLVELKGFGQKTQASLKEKLEFFQRSRGQYLYRTLDLAASVLREELQRLFPEARVERTGALRRCQPTLTKMAFVTTILPAEVPSIVGIEEVDVREEHTTGTVDGFPFLLYHVAAEYFGSKQFRYTGSSAFLRAFVDRFPNQDFTGLATEEAVFARAGVQFIPPELREDETYLDRAVTGDLPELIEVADVRGIVHSHSTYSDGIHTLRQMAEAARDRGYAYLVISDHSQSAFYAGGLKEGRVREQWAEIDALNEELAPFRIYKSIESDILTDGSLDYPDEILAGFDLVIASVHSNLGMDEAKATDRLLAAIRNPYTTVLGHPTGRLLLSRPGYPVDHRRIIDACAEHGVALELNANPYRLDVDWTWIPYAVERGVPISINPDAHSVGGLDDVRYGVLAARKGGLTKTDCWNATDVLSLSGK